MGQACDLSELSTANPLINDPVSEVGIQAGAVVSKFVQRGEGMNVTVFGSSYLPAPGCT